ncbi:MAG: indolepyruvate ferredoxin oxidoreductase, partial [Planctomycetota bacterium]
MPIELLLGDEAVALGALHAGIGGAFSYPGTPATEIFEFAALRAADRDDVSALWSANEKVAYEEALGMSYAGRRALVSMKHVGLNVAADPFMSSALTGVNGGMVLAVADDPGMHSSQNEQDSRYLAEFAQLPVIEPASQQECYDMTIAAFDLSERVKLPVMVRLVTRLAHSRANVRVRENAACESRRISERPDWRDWTLLPPNARRRYRRLLDLQKALREHAEHSPLNSLALRGPRGILAGGLGFNYVRESLGDDHDYSLLRIGAYPIPAGLVRRLVDHCDEITIIEEGYPFIEDRLLGLLGVPGKTIRGKRSGDLPPSGELTPDIVACALGVERAHHAEATEPVAARPPQLCAGCPHADAFAAIVAATEQYPNRALFGDIGCYTLGALPPYNGIHSCVDMGASIAMAHGAAQAGAHPVLAIIGDSTFAHSGMTALLDAVRV